MKPDGSSESPATRSRFRQLAALTIVGWGLAWLQMTTLLKLSDAAGSGADGKTGDALVPLAIFLTAAAAGLLLNRHQSRLEVEAGVASLREMEDRVAYDLLRQPDRFFEEHPLHALIGGLGRDLESAADRNVERLRCVRAIGDVIVAVAFFALSDTPGSTLIALGIATCAAAGGLLSHNRSKVAAKHGSRCTQTETELRNSLGEYLEARTEIHLAGYWREAVRLLGEKAAERSGNHSIRERARTEMDLILQGGQLLTLILFFSIGGADLGQATLLLPVLLREVPRVFSSAGRIVELLSRQDEHRRAWLRIKPCLLETDARHAAGPAPAALTSSPAAGLQVDGLTRTYRLPDGREIAGIHDVHLTLVPGTMAALVGQAGTGKSTLVRTIVGMETPDAGQVLLGHEDITRMSPEQRSGRISFMPQNSRLIAGSLLDNLVFASAPWGNPTTELELIESTGLGRLLREKALLIEPDPESWPEWRALTTTLGRPAGDNGGKPAATQTVLETLGADPASADALSSQSARIRGESSTIRRLFEEAGQMVFSSQARLLSLDSHSTYLGLAPVPLTERQWRRKRALLRDPGPDFHIEYALASLHGELSHAIGRSQSGFIDRLEAALASLRIRAIPPDEAASRRASSWMAALRALPAPGHGAWLDEPGPIRDFITLQGLRHRIGTCGHGLSSGQTQFVALTRALRRRSPLTILDEPTSAMDIPAKELVARCLRDFARDRIVLVISHDANVVHAADTVIELRDGRLASPTSPLTDDPLKERRSA